MYRIASNPGVYFFSATFTLATKQDQWLYKTGIHYLYVVLNQSFSDVIQMAADDICVADLPDAIYHEMDTVTRSHHVYT